MTAYKLLQESWHCYHIIWHKSGCQSLTTYLILLCDLCYDQHGISIIVSVTALMSLQVSCCWHFLKQKQLSTDNCLFSFDVYCNVSHIKDDNINGRFYLSHLLCVLSIKSGPICKSVYLYTIITCTDGMAVYMYPCMLLVTCVATAVCISMLILQSYGYILYYCSCFIILLDPPSYNVLSCGFCITILHLWEDESFLAAKDCQ